MIRLALRLPRVTHGTVSVQKGSIEMPRDMVRMSGLGKGASNEST
jgi:hypothetical protein